MLVWAEQVYKKSRQSVAISSSPDTRSLPCSMVMSSASRSSSIALNDGSGKSRFVHVSSIISKLIANLHDFTMLQGCSRGTPSNYPPIRDYWQRISSRSNEPKAIKFSRVWLFPQVRSHSTFHPRRSSAKSGCLAGGNYSATQSVGGPVTAGQIQLFQRHAAL